MILVADSGSTKTAWAAISAQGVVTMCDTVGLNPYLTDDKEFHNALVRVKNQCGYDFELIHFFGAGCNRSETHEMVEGYISEVFPMAKIQVRGDIYGACLAVLGEKSGFVGILGTGSSACHYYTLDFYRVQRSLGWILGDEGSGNHIGKRLIIDYFNHEMPQELSDSFRKEYNVTYDSVFDHIYDLPHPNAYLAHFAPFAHRNREHPYIKSLLYESFRQYLTHQIQPMQAKEIHLVGSVAYYFQEEIRHVADSMGISIAGAILKDPIEGLIYYYSDWVLRRS